MELRFDELLERTAASSFWGDYMTSASRDPFMCGVHLVVFSQPYLDLVLDGQKTVESRFSRNRCAPFGEVRQGDIILLKEVAGPVCGVALAERIWFYDLDNDPIDEIRVDYGSLICANQEFWEAKGDASFGTLIELSHPTTIAPIAFQKRDRRGWVALRPRQLELCF